MAVQSNAIAYNRLTPIREDFGDNLLQAENQGFRYREEQRIIDAIRDRKNKEFEEKYGINPNDYYLKDSEFRTVNDVGREAISKVRDELYNVKEKLRVNPNNLELKKKWDNLTLTAKSLRDGHSKFKAIGEDYLKRLNNDEISGLDEEQWRDRLEAYDEGRIKIGLDANGNLSYHFFDKDGKFKEDINYKDLIQGSLRNRIDIKKESREFLKLIGAIKKDEATGGFVKSINEWGEKQDAQADRLIDSYLEDSDILDDIAYQSGLNNVDLLDESVKRKAAKNYVKEVLKGAYNESNTLRPFNRPKDRLSFSDRKKMKTASTLFDISMRASLGEKAALDQIIGSRIKVQDGERTVEKVISDYAVTDKGTAFLDANGNEITVVENDDDRRRRALKFAMVIENGQSADNVQSTFETGESLRRGQYSLGDLSEIKKPVDVPDIDVKFVDELPNDEEQAVKFLKFNYGDNGFKFKSPINPFVEKVVITAPNGVEESFQTYQKEKIKDFLNKHSNKKVKFELKDKKKGKYD